MQKSAQNFLYLIILCLTSAVFWYLQPTIQTKSHGIILPAGIQKHPASRVADIEVLGHYPKEYQHIGLIRTTHHFESFELAQQDHNEQSNLELAKELAASLGANAIVITLLGHTAEVGPLDGTMLNAEAIYTTTPTSNAPTLKPPQE